MSDSRLSQAASAAAPDAGCVGVFGPPAGYDLSAFDRESLRIAQGFRPDHDHWEGAGFDVAPAISGPFTASVVVLPRSKPAAQALIAAAEAATPGGLVFVDGQKTDGVDSLFKTVRARAEVGGSVTKAHGRCFWFKADSQFADWSARANMIEARFRTMPGVFSADAVDRGSALLATALPEKLPARVADLGAGWGYLSDAILTRRGVEALDVVEADHVALDCARANIADPRATFHWADAARFGADKSYGAVVTNPPFHAGRKGDPELGRTFIRNARRVLLPSGTLWLVANRHLPYEAVLADTFRHVEVVAGDGGFKVIRASRPRVLR